MPRLCVHAHLTIVVLFTLLFSVPVHGGEFLASQLAFPRVRAAKAETDSVLRAYCTAKQLQYPPKEIFLRAFKREGLLEVWARDTVSGPFVLLVDYPICQRSGQLGPKRREGDMQVPEGFYHINIFNPVSNFHLSLGVNYPNASDNMLGYKPKLGGDIMIHGDCVTIGCIPITDPCIREVYWLAVQVHAGGLERIPVHIFPCRMDDAGMEYLSSERGTDTVTMGFWNTLKPGFAYFQRTKQLPVITVDVKGNYVVKGR
jgi:murein L,D-transpeptidase YafK